MPPTTGLCPSPCPHLGLCGGSCADLDEALWLLVLGGFLGDDDHWFHVLCQRGRPQEVWGVLWGQEVMVTPPWIFGRATGKEATPHCHEVLVCPSAASSGPLAVGTPPCTLKPLSNHRMLKPHRTSGSRGIWMSRLKYSMSEAFLKKLLRLEGGRKEKRLEGDVGRLGETPVPCVSPGYLRNCSWKRSRWPCKVSAGRPVAMGRGQQ